jgi:putative intracellular protease/amidase
MRIAIVLYPGFTALDAVGPYETLSPLPGAETFFVAEEPGPVVNDSAAVSRSLPRSPCQRWNRLTSSSFRAGCLSTSTFR